MSKKSMFVVWCAALGVLAILVGSSQAGHRFFRQRSVGGVSIDAEGVLGPPSKEATLMLRREMLKITKRPPGALGDKTELRKISLKELEAVIDDAITNNLGVLPDEVKYLAGLQRIQYVLVFPEENDIVLAGPGEGWKVNEDGAVVGVTTGRPVIHLDDLLVALRSVDDARRVGISCSIDPTEEGRRRVDALLRKLKVFNPQVPDLIEEALGPQKISVTGVPPTSHFARVMVAADYRMKRYAMNLEEAPVDGLKSFVDMSRGRTGNMMPRWWLACNYDAVARSEDGLAWQLRGQGVKTMTEEDFISEDGRATGTGRADPIAQRWADAFTAKYDELSTKDLVFGELRNLMDMCVIAAIIRKEGLLEKAGCSLPLLTGADSNLMIDSWNPPKTVATQANATKKGRNWIITASGGVQVESWRVASEPQVDDAVKQIRTRADQPDNNAPWWWN